MQAIEFQPLYMERVWGGRNLGGKLGRALPEGRVIGESWEVVDREETQSVVADGPLAGRTLARLRAEFGRDLLGPDLDPEKPFPVLVKWLDCRDRLSLQVHPPAAIAPELNGEPKTENWYIADADPGAGLIVGLRRGVTRGQFEAALRENRLEECIHRFEVAAGDSLLVESGRLHAIDAGNLILEIQQNSDTTYRVYDWGRVGLDGAPRQLHLEESMRSIDFNDFEPGPLKAVPGEQLLADCAEFRIRKFDLTPGDPPLALPAGGEPRLLHVVRGGVAAGGRGYRGGANLLQPYACDLAVTATEPATLLITDRFAGSAG